MIIHNYSNYFGIESKIASLPHYTSNFGPSASGAVYANNLAISGLGLQPNYAAAPSALMTGTTGGVNAQGTPKQGVLSANTYKAPTTTNNPSYPSNPSGQTSQTSSGGYNSYTAPSTYYDQGTGITFPSYEAFSNEVNRLYGEAEGLLGQTEQQTKAREQDYYTTASSRFDAQFPILQNAKQEGLTLNQQQIDSENRGREDALSRARNLANELMQGTRQRFGGASSAGEFAGAIIGRELQRNQAQAIDTAGSNIRKLLDKGSQIVNNYNTQLQSIEKEKAGAIAQARLQFQQRLDDINNSRIALASNKAQLKLSEFQNLRNQVLQIQQQSEANRQNIMSAIAQTQAQLASNVQQYRAQAGQAVNTQAIPQAYMSAYGGTNMPGLSTNITGIMSEDDRRRLGY